MAIFATHIDLELGSVKNCFLGNEWNNNSKADSWGKGHQQTAGQMAGTGLDQLVQAGSVILYLCNILLTPGSFVVFHVVRMKMVKQVVYFLPLSHP